MIKNKLHHEHDKIMKKILTNKKEAVILLNDTIQPIKRLKPENIETVEKEFVTYNFAIREADMIYKIQNEDVYIVVEHQSKTDYAMPYRIAQYKFETWERTINKEKYRRKEYKLPLVIGVLIYTGMPEWRAKQDTKEVETKYKTMLNKQLGISSFYFLIDVNNYNREELIEKGTLLSKIMILEKSKNLEELIENLEIVINKIEFEFQKKQTNIEEKDLLYNYISKVLLKKMPASKVNEILRKIKNKKGADVNMGKMAVFDMIERENRMYINRGKREEKMQVAQKLMQMKISIPKIKEATGLTEKELKKLKV